MKTWIGAIVVMAALAIPASSLAHEGHTHKALGTIASVQGDKVEITTTDDKTVTLVLDKKTTVTRGKDKLDVTALKAGERVSVEWTETKKVLRAQSIKLGTTQTARK
jgi:hypothetical protein